MRTLDVCVYMGWKLDTKQRHHGQVHMLPLLLFLSLMVLLQLFTTRWHNPQGSETSIEQAGKLRSCSGRTWLSSLCLQLFAVVSIRTNRSALSNSSVWEQRV